MSDTVTREDADGVATITLQKPGLSHALRTDLLALVREVAADEAVRAVLLTGSGRAFCVGQDLAEHVESLRGNAATSLGVVEEEYNPLVLALSWLRVPVVVGSSKRIVFNDLDANERVRVFDKGVVRDSEPETFGESFLLRDGKERDCPMKGPLAINNEVDGQNNPGEQAEDSSSHVAE